jgi:hypothetical protein
MNLVFPCDPRPTRHTTRAHNSPLVGERLKIPARREWSRRVGTEGRSLLVAGYPDPARPPDRGSPWFADPSDAVRFRSAPGLADCVR